MLRLPNAISVFIRCMIEKKSLSHTTHSDPHTRGYYMAEKICDEWQR